MSDDFDALQTVYHALEPLDDEARLRVIASVSTLLGMTQPGPAGAEQGRRERPDVAELPGPQQQQSRPKSLIELMQDKDPSTNPERIATFAYYRDKYESQPRFSRDDLEGYFQKARLSPPGNYGRDFAEVVRRGWIHEEGDASYLTTRGLESVESGFTGSSVPTRKKSSAKKPRSRKVLSTAKKSTAKKSTAKKSTAKKSTAKKSSKRTAGSRKSSSKRV